MLLLNRERKEEEDVVELRLGFVVVVVDLGGTAGAKEEEFEEEEEIVEIEEEVEGFIFGFIQGLTGAADFGLSLFISIDQKQR